MGLFNVGLGLNKNMAYLGFADGLFGLHDLIWVYSWLFWCFFMFTVVLYCAELWLVWCLFDCVVRFI